MINIERIGDSMTIRLIVRVARLGWPSALSSKKTPIERCGVGSHGLIASSATLRRLGLNGGDFTALMRRLVEEGVLLEAARLPSCPPSVLRKWFPTDEGLLAVRLWERDNAWKLEDRR